MNQAARKDSRRGQTDTSALRTDLSGCMGVDWGLESKEPGRNNKDTEARTHWQEREGLSNALVSLWVQQVSDNSPSLLDEFISFLIPQDFPNYSPCSQLNLCLALRHHLLLILLFRILLGQFLSIVPNQLQELGYRLPAFVVRGREDLPGM